MYYKPCPPEEEIQALADDFKATWGWKKKGAIAPWLLTHGPRLRALIKQGWTWEGIGRALTAAGIAYNTGAAWDGEVLRIKS